MWSGRTCIVAVGAHAKVHLVRPRVGHKLLAHAQDGVLNGKTHEREQESISGKGGGGAGKQGAAGGAQEYSIERDNSGPKVPLGLPQLTPGRAASRVTFGLSGTWPNQLEAAADAERTCAGSTPTA